ncbi:bacteriophage Gp15 family protein [Ligilactobacillus murinus]|nr:bacteriophage Gp15 family protein [Ligilactobacillus murinus]
MLSLTQDPLNEVIFNGKSYHLDLAFDTVLQYLQLSSDDDLSKEEKAEYAITLFLDEQDLPNDPEFYELIFKAVNEEITADPYGNNMPNSNPFGLAPIKYFDYVQDAEAIFASFMREYQINLLKQRGKMHWREFKALFDGLSENSYIQRIINIRQRDLSEIEDSKLQQQVSELKGYYALNGSDDKPDKQEHVAQTSALSAMFKAMQGQVKKGG